MPVMAEDLNSAADETSSVYIAMFLATNKVSLYTRRLSLTLSRSVCSFGPRLSVSSFVLAGILPLVVTLHTFTIH
jgi:hypothetical protein